VSGAPVSVVIPTYQRVASCRRAVESVVAQTLAPAEILVCDDGSTDETRDEIERLERREPLVRYLRLPENTGRPACARNAGVRASTQPWVAFLDDDDRWLPNKLARQAPFLTAPYAVVASGAKRSSGGDFHDVTRPLGTSGGVAVEIRPRRLYQENPLILSTAIVAKEALLEAGGFPEERTLAGVEDYALWLALADRGHRFLLVREPLAVYGDGDGTRFSDDAARLQRAAAGRVVAHLRRRPSSLAAWEGALRHTSRLVKIAARRRAASRRSTA
jgi:glycosyltransferase involved in cell wall biosynthesis